MDDVEFYDRKTTEELEETRSALQDLTRHPGWALIQRELSQKHDAAIQSLVSGKAEDASYYQGVLFVVRDLLERPHYLLADNDQPSVRQAMIDYLNERIEDRAPAEPDVAPRRRERI